MSSVKSFDESNVLADIKFQIDNAEVDGVTYAATSDGPSLIVTVTVTDASGDTRRFQLDINEIN